MRINLREIFIENILNNYDSFDDPKFLKDYNEKERNIWDFIDSVGRRNIDNPIVDTITDKNWLNNALEVFNSGIQSKATFDYADFVSFISKYQ